MSTPFGTLEPNHWSIEPRKGVALGQLRQKPLRVLTEVKFFTRGPRELSTALYITNVHR